MRGLVWCKRTPATLQTRYMCIVWGSGDYKIHSDTTVTQPPSNTESTKWSVWFWACTHAYGLISKDVTVLQIRGWGWELWTTSTFSLRFRFDLSCNRKEGQDMFSHLDHSLTSIFKDITHSFFKCHYNTQSYFYPTYFNSRHLLLPAIQLGMPGNTPLGLPFVDSSFLFWKEVRNKFKLKRCQTAAKTHTKKKP